MTPQAVMHRGCKVKLEVQGQRGGKILDVAGQGGQFSWTPYVYRPLEKISFFCRLSEAATGGVL